MAIEVKIKKIFILFVIVLLLNISFLPAAGAQQYGPDLFREIYDLVKEYYVDPIEDDFLYQGAVEGMLWYLDPYSGYYTEDEYEQLLDYLENAYSGIGVYLEEAEGFIRITGVIADSPASRAGIIAGDRIIAVDGTNIVGYSLYEAGLLIEGGKGTEVTLLIQREGKAEFIEVKLVREKVTVPTVDYRIIEGNLGYLRLDAFNEQADYYTGSALSHFHQRDVAGLILDLRNNPGGYLYSAVDIAGYFIEGPAVYLAGRDGEKQSLTAPQRDNWDKPLVVLVNYYTASAAEILAGAIQDYEKGFLVGFYTYGKGSSQSLIQLEQGGYLKLSTYYLYTPLGKEINWVGIEPDYLVEEEGEIYSRGQAVLWDMLYPGSTVFVLKSYTTFSAGFAGIINTAPEMINGQLYLPLRSLLNVFSFEPTWNPESKKISFSADEGLEVSFRTGDKAVMAGGRQYFLSAPVIIKSGTAMVPMEFLDACGMKYELSADRKAVIVYPGK